MLTSVSSSTKVIFNLFPPVICLISSCHLPNVSSMSTGRCTVYLRYLRINPVIWKVDGRYPCSGPAATYIQAYARHQILSCGRGWCLLGLKAIWWSFGHTGCILSLTWGLFSSIPPPRVMKGLAPSEHEEVFTSEGGRRYAAQPKKKKSCYCSTPALLHSVCSCKQAPPPLMYVHF